MSRKPRTHWSGLFFEEPPKPPVVKPPPAPPAPVADDEAAEPSWLADAPPTDLTAIDRDVEEAER